MGSLLADGEKKIPKRGRFFKKIGDERVKERYNSRQFYEHI